MFAVAGLCVCVSSCILFSLRLRSTVWCEATTRSGHVRWPEGRLAASCKVAATAQSVLLMLRRLRSCSATGCGSCTARCSAIPPQ
jgi:hypothetical protein